MNYRKSRYTPDFKLRALTALDANGGRLRETAKQFGIASDTLSDWNRHREEIMQQTRLYRSDGQLSLEARFDMIAQLLLNTLPEKIENAKLTDTLRAMTMLNALRQTFETQQQEMSTAHEKLGMLIDRYRKRREETVIQRGGRAQLEALHKAQAEVDAILSEDEPEQDDAPPW
ncbi:MAG: transposase [Chloroflexota bacterium]